MAGSYRAEKQSTMKIVLHDEDAEIDPAPAAGGGHLPDPQRDLLSNIVKALNELWGNIDWSDADRVQRLIAEDIPSRVAADSAYQNAMKNNDEQNARIEHDRALAHVMSGVIRDDTQLFKYFSDNESFNRWLSDMVFAATYQRPEPDESS